MSDRQIEISVDEFNLEFNLSFGGVRITIPDPSPSDTKARNAAKGVKTLQGLVRALSQRIDSLELASALDDEALIKFSERIDALEVVNAVEDES